MRYLCIRPENRTRSRTGTREDTCYYTCAPRTRKNEGEPMEGEGEGEDRVPEGTRHEPRLLGSNIVVFLA